MKKVKLEWYCLEWDINKNKPVMTNIFYVIDLDDLETKIKYKGKIQHKSIKNYEELREYLRSKFMYHFWSKCEHEIIVNSWPHNGDATEKKIDIYSQISPNLDSITEYVILKLGLKFERDCEEHHDCFGLERS